MIDLMEKTSGKTIGNSARKVIARGADEIDLVRSGLEETMINSFYQIREVKNRRKKGEGFVDFNLEQQGDIIADYFLLVNGYKTQWGYARIEDLPIYQRYVDELGGKRV